VISFKPRLGSKMPAAFTVFPVHMMLMFVFDRTAGNKLQWDYNLNF
jgi:hypothetical protein